MSLQIYRKKRDFKSTPEPKKKKDQSVSKKFPVFCVQKHAATRLHYDFRIECKGVMLSWAIPKGPSLDPNQKRLAVHVEDHPLEYRHFEGVIPEGNYGAGSVMIWDEGFYATPNATTKKDIEDAVWKGFQEGRIELDLLGKKLRGGFVLIKIKQNEKNWLFIKRKDEETDTKHDILDQDRSVRTLRSMEEIAGGKSDPQKKQTSKGKKSSRMPEFVKPMLASLVDEPFDSDEWLFEIKWDGYRALARIDKKIDLLSRNEQSFNAQFSPIVEDLAKLKAQAILDGEIVVVDNAGRSQFQLIQNFQRSNKQNLYYYVFDLLYQDGEDLRNLPLMIRKQRLKELLTSFSFSKVRYSDHVLTKGKEFFKIAMKSKLEGIMAKKLDSAYVSQRSRNWLKIKTHMRQEAVIGGFTKPRGSRQYFGALLLGVYNEEKKLVYIGHVGGGFNTRLLQDIYAKMKPLIQKKCPFEKTPKTNTPSVWIKPKLVCEVSFGEWTQDGRLRQPIFQGMRMDKKATSVKREEVLAVVDKKSKANKKSVQDDSKVKLSNLEKVFWPKLKLTKGDLVEYYLQVADFILPYLKNRPMMLRRFPDGVNGESFIQKDSKGLNLPSWIQTISIKHEKKTIAYFLIQDKESLEFIVNLGSIEMHPFLSQIDKPQNPDYFVIDLDPENIEFEKVIVTAKKLHETLDKFNITSVCKTSGKRGMHICIPLGQNYTYDQALQFGQIIVQYVHEQIPEFTSLVRQPAKRQKKVYLDVLQNHYKKTVIAPYSARGTELATVSTPLKWSEVKVGLDPRDFNITNLPKRLKKVGDVFAPALGHGINMSKVLRELSHI